ncbi:hypothetical protein Tco_0891876 [Tanacetum coccineum]|uniref:F-box domain-containing protein n=1 Tax=Tanacetum coccineum TaxID=301880 RepID=A0ABQ5CAA3_9ASTR
MSENIPFDLQLAIMNRLPVKSLLQFRTVSKSWKYSIDCSDFVREYGFRESNNCQAVVGGKILWVIDMPEEMLVGQCLPPYYISQLGDCIIISGSFKFVDFSIIYAWELQVDDGEVSCSTHVEPSPLTPNPVTIIPGPAGIVQLSSSTRVEPSSSTSNPVRIIPSPAGLVQRAKLLKENVFILDPDGALMSTQEYMQKVVEDVGEDVDFNSGAWVCATNYVNALGGTVTGCLGDIDNFLKKEKLEQVVAIVKSCSPNALGDLNVTLKDLSGTVPGTINYKFLDVGSYGKDITIEAAMILANVSVFTPKPSKHYLNVTKRIMVEVFRKDTVLGSGSG